SPIKARQKEIKSIPQVFIYGMLFAIGFSACVGPILAGILLMASILPPAKALLLMFFYSIGYAVPFMGLSYFFDKIKITEIGIFKKKIQLDFSSKKITLHLTNIIGGLLFIALGVLFIGFKGTSIFNKTTPLTFLDYEIQRRLINLNIPISNIILVILLALVGIFVWRSYRGLNNGKKTSE
ncbi:MAG: cytochrome c biogenesis CcdA family protein, partial [Fervidobacterium sp.]